MVSVLTLFYFPRSCLISHTASPCAINSSSISWTSVVVTRSNTAWGMLLHVLCYDWKLRWFGYLFIESSELLLTGNIFIKVYSIISLAVCNFHCFKFAYGLLDVKSGT
jgi:hypothetical protein